MNENYNDCHQRKTTSTFLYTKSKKLRNVFIYKKSDTFQKVRQFPLHFLYTKCKTIYVTRFSVKMLNLAFIYKKYDTLCYVTFLYTKGETHRKKQDNLRYLFNTKIQTLCVTQFLIEFLKLAEAGGYFYLKKKHFALHFYKQKNALCVTFL